MNSKESYRRLALATLCIAILLSAVSAEGRGRKSPGTAGEGEELLHLAILELDGEVLDDPDRVHLAENIRSVCVEYLDSSVWKVLTREALLDTLAEQETDLGSLGLDTGAYGLGDALGADAIITGSVRLFAGRYHVSLRMHDLARRLPLDNVEATASTVEGLEPEVEVAARRLLASLGNWGSEIVGARHVVHFESEPQGASVFVNGVYVCDTDIRCSRALTEGTHEIKMVLQHHHDEVVAIDVTEPMTVSRTLRPSVGWLTVRTEPEDVTLMVGGQVMSSTQAVRLQHPPGTYTVIITDSNWEKQSKQVAVREGDETKVLLVARPRTGKLVVEARDDRGNDLSMEVMIDGEPVGTSPWSGELSVGPHEVMLGSRPVAVRVKDVKTTYVVEQFDAANLVVTASMDDPENWYLMAVPREPESCTVGIVEILREANDDTRPEYVVFFDGAWDVGNVTGRLYECAIEANIQLPVERKLPPGPYYIVGHRLKAPLDDRCVHAWYEDWDDVFRPADGNGPIIVTEVVVPVDGVAAHHIPSEHVGSWAGDSF